MARMLPKNLPVNTTWSEKRVYEAFSELSEAWTVLWDVPVGLFGIPRPGLRQIDFLLLHPEIGALVVEVKGGEIRVEQGEWSTRPEGSTDFVSLKQSPFKQVTDQHFQLKRFLSDRLHWRGISIGHAVCFPASVVDVDLGPDAPRDLIIDIRDLENPATALHRVAQAWNLSGFEHPDQVTEIVKVLRPSRTLNIVLAASARDTLADIDRETRRQVELVEGQMTVFEELLHTNRACVVGGAGTGKTILACERVRALEKVGSRTLLLCHRSVVRSFMLTVLDVAHRNRQFEVESDALLHVAHWAGLLDVLSTSTEVAIPSARSSNLVDAFLTVRDRLPKLYDAIVVDEGQEFTSAQFESLQWLLVDPEQSPLYIFADPFQHSGMLSTPALERRSRAVRFQWESPLATQMLPLTVNCRNSDAIAKTAYGFYPFDAPKAVARGPQPRFTRVASADDVIDGVLTEAKRLVEEEGFARNQILSVFAGIPIDRVLRRALRFGMTVVEVEHLYRYPLTPREVRFVIGTPDTVQGLEADVVVVGLWSGSELTMSDLRDAYIASSRARGVLEFFSPFDEWALQAGASAVINHSEDAAVDDEELKDENP